MVSLEIYDEATNGEATDEATNGEATNEATHGAMNEATHATFLYKYRTVFIYD